MGEFYLKEVNFLRPYRVFRTTEEHWINANGLPVRHLRRMTIEATAETRFVEYRSDAPNVITQAISPGLTAEEPHREDNLTVVRLRFATPVQPGVVRDIAYDSQLRYTQQPEPTCCVQATRLISDVRIIVHFAAPPQQLWACLWSAQGECGDRVAVTPAPRVEQSWRKVDQKGVGLMWQF